MILDDKTLLDTTPPAYAACVVACDDPDCGKPHIVLLDENNKPLFQYVMSVEFFRAIQNAMPEWKDN